MKKIFLYFILPIITLVLEILPYGVVCNFAYQNIDGTIGIRKSLYSYFDLFPWGYASFSPFITAILTCVFFLLLIIFFISRKNGMLLAAKTVLCICVLFSLFPLVFGFSIVGGLISVSLILEFILLLLKLKQ